MGANPQWASWRELPKCRVERRARVGREDLGAEDGEVVFLPAHAELSRGEITTPQ
jgi:hypothetical protein